MKTDRSHSPQSSPQLAIAKRIRAERLRKGWNQLVLAAKAGVSRTTLFQLERGAIPTPRAITLHRLACALEIPVAWLNPSEQSAPADEQRPRVPPALTSAGEFDRRTNPYVDVVAQQYPQIFSGFAADDWDELYGSFGTGGALTEEGVLQTSLKIARKRETLRRVSILLETHLADPTRAMVDSLFQLIEVPCPVMDEPRPA